MLHSRSPICNSHSRPPIWRLVSLLGLLFTIILPVACDQPPATPTPLPPIPTPAPRESRLLPRHARAATNLAHGGKFYNLAWSPDGRWLVGGATDYKLWRADGTEVAHTPKGTPAWGLAWAPDSTRWATGDESGNLILYDTAGHMRADSHNP